MNKKFLFSFLLLIGSCFLGSPLKAEIINMYHGTQTTDEGKFYDEGGSLNNYPATDLGTMTLTLESSTYYNFGSGFVASLLQFNFTMFAIGFGDTLFIYDGQDQNAPLIGAYSGVNSPGLITSSTKYITFVFYSDGIADLNGLNAGWKADFGYYFNTPKVFNLSPTLALTENQTCNAILYDSGGPSGNFASGEDKTIVFTSQLGTYIKAKRITFDVGTNILEIWDGNLPGDPTNARRIGYFKNGYLPPDSLISSGPSMSFKFVTTSTGPGFRFDISCVEEIYKPSPTQSACPRVVLGPYAGTGHLCLRIPSLSIVTIL